MKRKINDEKKIIASNFASLAVLQAANYLLPLLVLPFLVRILGSEKFGLIMFAQATATFLMVAVDFGFAISGTREISINRHDKNKISQVFSAIILIKLALAIFWFVVLFLVVESIQRFKSDAIIYYLSFGTVIGHAIFPVWFYQGIEKMKFVTGVNILSKLIFTILIFVVIRKESDYLLVPVFNSIGYIVSGLLGFILCFKYVQFVKPKIILIKRLINDSTSLYLGKFATNLYTTCNVLILGLFVGNSIVGVYASMEKLLLAVKNIFAPFFQAMFPWLSKQSPLKRVSILKKIFPYLLAIGILITTMILLFAESILDVIYDDELITSYSTIFRILSSIAIFASMNMLFTNLFFPAVKKYKIRMYIFIFGGIFNLILSLILVKFYGIFGMAIAVVTTEFFLLVLGIYYFKKYLLKLSKDV